MKRVIVDECVFKSTTDLLKSKGLDIVTVYDLDMEGALNNIIFNRAIKEETVFITNDTDFGDIRQYPPKTHFGLIVLKICKRNETKVHDKLSEFIDSKDFPKIDKSLVVIDHNKWRMRK